MKVRKRRYRHEEEENFWPAFTDVVSTIALILFFLMLLTFINNIVSGKNLEYAKKELMDTQKQLERSKAEISQAENQLRLLEDELEDTAAEVEEGQIALKLSEQEIEDQREIIAASNAELGNLRTKLKGIAVLRLDVLKKVKSSMESNLSTSGDDSPVRISDTGNIVINEALVFDSDSYTIKEEARELLDELAISFENVLDNSEISNNIDSIDIQGHTDERGSDEYNRELGAKRASAVVNYLLESNSKLKSKYANYFSASSYSEFRPVDNSGTESAYSKNRRIEISIVLKDSNVQKIIDSYLEESIENFSTEESEETSSND